MGKYQDCTDDSWGLICCPRLGFNQFTYKRNKCGLLAGRGRKHIFCFSHRDIRYDFMADIFQNAMNSRILKFEIWGIFFISFFGSFLHFTFNWTNRFLLVGAFSAVNESTWEHLKLAVFPAFIWAVMESKVFKLKANNFLFAKATAVYLMPLLIIFFFYSYTAILGYNLLVFDISTFIVSVIIGQIANYKIMNQSEFSQKWGKISLLPLIVLVLAFIIFTFWTPHNFLFLDPVSDGYGIIK
jgi:hypothetical protein